MRATAPREMSETSAGWAAVPDHSAYGIMSTVQLNIHVPRAREHVVRELEDLARESDHPKSELVLDAVEQYVRRQRRARRANIELPVFPGMGVIGPLRREDIYEERLDHVLGTE